MKTKYVIIDLFLVVLFLVLVGWIAKLTVENHKVKEEIKGYQVARGKNLYKENRAAELTEIIKLTYRRPAPVGCLAGTRQQENGASRAYGVTAIMPGCENEKNKQLASAAYIMQEVMTDMVTDPKYMDEFMNRLVKRWNPNNGADGAHEIWKKNVMCSWIEYQKSIHDKRYIPKEKGLKAVRRK